MDKRLYHGGVFEYLPQATGRPIRRPKTRALNLAERKPKNPINLSPPPGRRHAKILKPPSPVRLAHLRRDGRTVFGYSRNTNLGRAANFLYLHRQTEHLLPRFIMLVYGIGATVDTHLFKARWLLRALDKRARRDGYRVQTAMHPRRVGLFKMENP